MCPVVRGKELKSVEFDVKVANNTDSRDLVHRTHLSQGIQ